jgi:hypothetical protein
MICPSMMKQYITLNNVTETTPGQSDRAACLLTTASPYLIMPPEELKNRGQIDLNPNDYHFEPMEKSRTYWIPHLTD